MTTATSFRVFGADGKPLNAFAQAETIFNVKKAQLRQIAEATGQARVWTVDFDEHERMVMVELENGIYSRYRDGQCIWSDAR